jgi:glycosyltransferase involved in cell wall biosynthesis
MTEPQLLTVVMPVFNERATFRESLERLLKVDLPLPLEILVVDDGSFDGTIESANDLGTDERVRIVRHRRNRGKGAAVRTGIEAARGDVLTVLDGDLEYDPNDYRALLKPILSGEAEVAFGTREFGAHTAYSFWFVIGNKVLAFWTSFLFNAWVSDVETCFKMAHTHLLRSLHLRSNGFGIEAETTAKVLRSGHRIWEVPISYRARSRAEGKKLRWQDGVHALWICLRIRLLGR